MFMVHVHKIEMQAGDAFALADAAHPPRTCNDEPHVDYIDMSFTDRGADSILEAIVARPPEAPFAYIVTPNVDHLVRLHHSRSDLWPTYRAAWMTLCDSRILARLARRMGCALPVIPGSDLTRMMFDQVIGTDDRIAIVGGQPELVASLAKRYGLTDVQHYNPPMGFINQAFEVAKAAAFLKRARARYNFIALGSPQQEMLAYKVARAGGATGIGLCVGASLDFLTGKEERAPLIMQQMCLEWLFRLSSNPRRMWRRYLIDGPGIFPIERRWRLTHPRETLDDVGG